MPWHAPHAAAAPDRSVQTGTTAGVPAKSAPWHAVFVHDVPFQAGDAPRSVARPPKVTSTTPSRWPGDSTVAGTTWQSEHATGVVMVGLMCAGCANVDGHGSDPVPWQAPQVPFPLPSSTRPSRWSGPPDNAVPVALASAWHSLQGPEK